MTTIEVLIGPMLDNRCFFQTFFREGGCLPSSVFGENLCPLLKKIMNIKNYII